MTLYHLLDHAEIDFLEICVYLEARNSSAALRWERLALEAFDHVARYPATGHIRPDLAREAFRVWPIEQYVVIYHPETKPVTIVAILHGARDIAAILMSRKGNQAKEG